MAPGTDEDTARGGGGWAALWERVAWLPLFALIGALLYLGARPGGTAPIFVYMTGRLLIGMLSLALFIWGLAVSMLKRPFIQGRRLRAFSFVTLSLIASNYPLPYPSSREGRPSSVEFELPVAGEWVVLWGGEGRDENRLAGFYPDQRWGMHLVREVDGAIHSGDASESAQHHCHGEQVFAPARGEVVGVVDGIEDDVQVTSGSSAFGNHLVIRVAEGEYLFLTQLLAGSLAPKLGDVVERGQPLARVGASGYSPVSPMPHLGLHLQTSPTPTEGEGIPWSFWRYQAGGVEVARGLPPGGVGRDGALLGARVSHSGRSGEF
ncbi:MAG: M23 family metallopeptidase [Planctomycetes bacterium]|nr:M23 family metallopeptidase [Planctomycetota bacterium]